MSIGSYFGLHQQRQSRMILDVEEPTAFQAAKTQANVVLLPIFDLNTLERDGICGAETLTLQLRQHASMNITKAAFFACPQVCI